jgi:hypothetical protein
MLLPTAEYQKYWDGIVSNGIMFTSNFVKIGQLIQKLKDVYTATAQSV